MLSGGSCRGMVFRVDKVHARQVMINLWQREMVTAVYDPRWLVCHTPHGPVRALAFTLSRKSPNHTGELPDHEYCRIFEQAVDATAPPATTPRPPMTSCASTASTTGLWLG